jgi:hypothetical protein
MASHGIATTKEDAMRALVFLTIVPLAARCASGTTEENPSGTTR